MTLRVRTLGVAVLGAALAALAACEKQAADPPPAPVADAGRPPVAVTVAPVTAADVTETIDVVGSITPKFVTDVKSEVTGTVVQVYVNEWVPVRKGARLARLDTTETEAGIEALRAVEAQARVAEARARREHARALQLKEYGLITTQALDEATSAVEAAQAAVTSAQAQVRAAQARLAKSYINAPMDGVVAQRNVNTGDRVENMGGNSPMFRIVDNRTLDVTVTVPTSRLPDVRVGQPLEFTTDAMPDRTFIGKVMFINPTVDEANRSAKVIAEVPNPEGLLKGGLFVKGHLIVAVRAGVVQVPREALLNWNVAGRSAEVFTVKDGQAEKRQVKVGASEGATVEVSSGLAAGDQVVTRGGFALRPGDRVRIGQASEGA